MEIIVELISLGLLIFLIIFEVYRSFHVQKKPEKQTVKTSENFENKREDDMNEEEIVAVINAAIMAYSSDKIVKTQKTKQKVVECSNRWLAHSPQIFWKSRRE